MKEQFVTITLCPGHRTGTATISEVDVSRTSIHPALIYPSDVRIYLSNSTTVYVTRSENIDTKLDVSFKLTDRYAEYLDRVQKEGLE